MDIPRNISLLLNGGKRYLGDVKNSSILFCIIVCHTTDCLKHLVKFVVVNEINQKQYRFNNSIDMNISIKYS